MAFNLADQDVIPSRSFSLPSEPPDRFADFDILVGSGSPDRLPNLFAFELTLCLGKQLG